MQKAAGKLAEKEMIRACWASRASQLTSEAFLSLIDSFSGPKEMPDFDQVESKALSASSEQARYAVMAAFSADNRIDRAVKVIH